MCLDFRNKSPGVEALKSMFDMCECLIVLTVHALPNMRFRVRLEY